jgi:tRNA(Arg) A34 adenosine deaminase TadA
MLFFSEGDNLMDEKDLDLLRKAISLAQSARKQGQEPFGAVLAKDGKIMAEGINEVYALSDPTAHAENLLIRTFCQKQKTMNLKGYTLYCSAEPCFMCIGAIYWAKISKVIYSISQDHLHQISGGSEKPDTRMWIKSNSGIEVIGPELVEEGRSVFNGFQFKKKT